MSQSEDDGTVVRVSESGAACIPERLREEHGIETPGKIRLRETPAGELVVEPVESITEFRGNAPSGWPGTTKLHEERADDLEREE